MGGFDFFAGCSSFSMASDPLLWQHPSMSEMESLLLKAFRRNTHPCYE